MGYDNAKHFLSRAIQAMVFLSQTALRPKLEAHRAARNAAAAAAGAGAAGAGAAGAAAGAAPSTFQPILAVAGVGGTTANGLAGARQFLDDWCALSEAERREIRAFRDWHAANIKP